jgi:hypothetical protein
VLKYKKRVLHQIEGACHSAPYFNLVFPLLTSLCTDTETNLANFLVGHLTRLFPFITTKQQQWPKGAGPSYRDKQDYRFTHYINSIGGKKLYNQDAFKRAGIKLSFLETNDIHYPQFQNSFVPSLSIIDILIFNEKKRVKEMIEGYRLIS